MFPSVYFPDSYFAPVYFPKAGAESQEPLYIEQAMYELMSDITGLVALIGTADNILPRDDQQNRDLPYIKHFVVANTPLHTYQALVAQERFAFYQVSLFAADMLTCRRMADQLKAHLDGHHLVGTPARGITVFLLNERVVEYDQEIRAVHLALDFEVFFENSALM